MLVKWDNRLYYLRWHLEVFIYQLYFAIQSSFCMATTEWKWVIATTINRNSSWISHAPIILSNEDVCGYHPKLALGLQCITNNYHRKTIDFLVIHGIQMARVVNIKSTFSLRLLKSFWLQWCNVTYVSTKYDFSNDSSINKHETK